MYFLYDIAATFAAAVGLVWVALSRKHRVLLGRFRAAVPTQAGAHPLWVQACSVGEVKTALPVLDDYRKRHPDTPIVLTTSTRTGFDTARAAASMAHVAWCPFDHPLIVRRFVRKLAPSALVLVETELWPSILREADRAGVPVVVVNGRISDKHFSRYKRFGRVTRRMVQYLTAVGAQNQEYADRFASLGVEAGSIQVTGNLKFDAVPMVTDPTRRSRIKENNGFLPGQPILVFGSTRPGDEELAAQCWRELRDEFPELRLVIAPRHIDRLRDAVAPFEEPILRRSQVRRLRKGDAERVFILDTLGELVDFYSIATVAVVGGSFYPGVNGHNPLEPAALGIPTVFGPHMRNFADPARVLVEANGAIQVSAPEELQEVLRNLLADVEARLRLAAQGRQVVARNQGVVQRNVDLIDAVISQRSQTS